MKNLLTLKNWTKEEIRFVIESAIKIKKNPLHWSKKLQNKVLVMIFEKSSTRTRLSFEAGMAQVGGNAIFLDWKDSHFSTGAELKDEIRSIERYCNVISARVKKHSTLKVISENVKIPVINMLCEKYHPCQALADMMTIKEKAGEWKGKTLVFTGIANNVSNSLVEAGTKLGMNIILAVPEKDPDAVDKEIEKQAKKTGLCKETKDLKNAVKNADFIYTDTWINMEFMNDPSFAQEKKRRLKSFMPYQVNSILLKKAKENAKVMHCLPAHIGYEITRNAVEHPNSIIFDQAENRMHVQKAVLLYLLDMLI